MVTIVLISKTKVGTTLTGHWRSKTNVRTREGKVLSVCNPEWWWGKGEAEYFEIQFLTSEISEIWVQVS